MTENLADHRKASLGGRVQQFLCVSKAQRKLPWLALHRRALTRAAGNRRVVEFVRIARGKQI